MPNTKEKGKLIEVLSKHIPYGYATLCLIADELMAEGVTVREWISVKDRLPEPFTSVLAYVPSEAPLPLVHESYFVDAPQVWVCIIEKRPWKQGAVTHWMPLPEPPEGE